MNRTTTTTPTSLHRPRSRNGAWAAALALLAGLVCLPLAAAASYGTAAPPAEEPAWSGEASYSYFRVVEGTATLLQGDTGERQEVEPNQPLLAGDRLWVAPDARLELVLSDRNLLRLGGGSEVLFETLAASPDRGDRETVVRLLAGELQMVALADSLGESPPRIETPNATVYIPEEGVYRVSAERAEWSRVTVRDGRAEVVTERGSLLLRGGEEAVIEGASWPQASVATAGPEDELERWGHDLVARAERAATGAWDDPSLGYAAAPLDDYGAWLEVDGGRAWQPRVAADWRPYWDGYWRPTPSGLFWVSSEPWGWVPYHYGSWSLHPLHGWLWYPGSVFSPAWVYWYWGPSHVAWVPVGYYTHHYAPRFALHFGGPHFGFHFGHYGYAGGHHRHFRHWNFCSLHDFGRHDLRRHLHGGYGSGGHGGHGYGGYDDHRTRRDVVPRGLITTDTRGITRADLRRPETLGEELARRGRDRGVAVRRGGGEPLPDVTPFVAREPELPAELERRLVARSPEDIRRVAGTPLAPRTVRPAGETRVSPRALRPASPSTPRPETPAVSRPGGGEPALNVRTVRPAERSPTAARPQEPPARERRTLSPRPAAPERPSASVRPASPRPTRSERPEASRPEVRSVRPSAPRTESAAPPRPEVRRPASPEPRPELRDRTAPRTVRPSIVRPSTPARPSVRPSAPSRPSTVRPSTPSRPSARQGTAPSRPSVRPSSPSRPSVRPSSPSRSSGRSSGVSSSGSGGRSTARSAPSRGNSSRGSSGRRSAARSRGGGG